MKKALILGALAGQVDAVETLKARGVETHVCAHERSGPGVEAADYFHLVDITKPEEVAALASEIGADVVYSVGSDIAMPTVAAVSERLELPMFHSVEVTDMLRRKQSMRKRLNEAGLSPVKYEAVNPGDPIPAWDVFPAIVKPVDSQGQRGITIVESYEELEDAVAFAQKAAVSGPAIIEEVLEGPEVSAHALVEDGKMIFFLPSDRHVWDGPMVGLAEGHSVPLGASTAQWEEELRALTEGIVEAFNVEEGPLYVQAIVTQEGPRVVEVASRLDGCHLWRLIHLSTGVDIMDAVLGRLLGDPWPDFSQAAAPEPSTLDFLFAPPTEAVTLDRVSEDIKDTAVFAETQFQEGKLPRQTNAPVARVGYQVYPQED